jgi:hypothetical protein
MEPNLAKVNTVMQMLVLMTMTVHQPHVIMEHVNLVTIKTLTNFVMDRLVQWTTTVFQRLV